VGFVIVLVVLAVVVLVISGPLRAAARMPADPNPEPDKRAAEIDELEAEREAKLSEIRDAEFDHETGKLSDEDYEALDAGLRVEAVEILRRLDATRDRRLDAAPEATGAERVE
jgi:hypothetical protein